MGHHRYAEDSTNHRLPGLLIMRSWILQTVAVVALFVCLFESNYPRMQSKPSAILTKGPAEGTPRPPPDSQAAHCPPEGGATTTTAL